LTPLAQTLVLPGIVHIIGPEQGFTVCDVEFLAFKLCLSFISSLASHVYVVILIRQVSDTRCSEHSHSHCHSP
jgi:hypothetical protein